MRVNAASPALEKALETIRSLDRCALITDLNQPDNPIIYVSEAFIRHTGYARDETVGRNCRFLQGPGTDPVVRAEVRKAVEARRAIKVRILNYRKDGTPFLNVLQITPIFRSDGTAEAFFGVQSPEPKQDGAAQEVLKS